MRCFFSLSRDAVVVSGHVIEDNFGDDILPKINWCLCESVATVLGWQKDLSFN